MEINLEYIISILMAVAPALTSIIGIVVAVTKMFKNNKITSSEVIEKFEEVRREVMNTKQYEQIKSQLLVSHQENRELKKQINELLTKIDKVVRED